MNLGDGLKLETEILDGKPRLIVATCVNKSKPTIKMCNKNKIIKHTSRTKLNGHVLKSVQTSCEKNECFTKHKTGSRFSVTNDSKTPETLICVKDLSNEPSSKNHAAKPDYTRISVKKSLASNKKFKKHPASVEDLRDNLVCLTQQQLEQILMAVKEGTKVQDEKKEEAILESSDNNIPPDEATEENIMGLLQKAEIPTVSSENSFISSKKQGTFKHAEQKIITRNSWKPADMFSTLGERERDKSLLDAKRSQWKKELDEQVALKKKLKEALETESKYCPFWHKTDVRSCSEKWQLAQDKMAFSDDLSATTEDSHICRCVTTETSEVSPSVLSGQTGQFSSFSSPDLPAAIRTAFVLGEPAPVEHPFSAVKREQQKKWLEELDKQKEADKLRKLEEKCNLSKGEEHDKWTMHFDSFRNQANSFSQCPLNSTYKKQAEALHLPPEVQKQTAFTPTTSCHSTPTEIEVSGKTSRSNISESSQKASFLRSMTALLDPAQIEERERRRQKQLEHQKAIMAQVEEKRKQKQLEVEQRKQEDQEEEQRLAKEQELMKKQFEEDLLKQKQKEEIMALKTNVLYQTMQKAQELAQRLKQEQRIKELAEKGHDTSKLQKNIGSSDINYESYCTDLDGLLNVTDHHDDFCEGSRSIVNHDVKTVLSPRKDTAVQTESNTDVPISTENSAMQIGSASPDITAEYKANFSNKKCKKEVQCLEKKISEKENIVAYSNIYEQSAQQQKQPKEKNEQRPDWNINKPCKRYIPASEKYPRRLQKQREEKKARRQMELLQLVERNTPRHLSQKSVISPDRPLSPPSEDGVKNKEESLLKNNLVELRSDSPPVPAVKNRLQQQTKTSDFSTHDRNDGREKSITINKHQSERPSNFAPERPPSSHFVPYVRTNEVYYLDPDAPMTRPSTHDPQYHQLNDVYYTPRQTFSSDHVRDPLFNPNVVRDRQQAILKGLSELRQGLLQKQKELETCLIPSIINQEENFISLL
ncbi:coiled-coil domain-containing protein 66 isoform X3 [Anolis carolinensis]|uniref:coiled-coil domain-containing protein 66 isoform X3 n=1 Tax=Anolis carolinensis TaxID=28377 RepID=UPI002F2B661B